MNKQHILIGAVILIIASALWAARSMLGGGPSPAETARRLAAGPADSDTDTAAPEEARTPAARTATRDAGDTGSRRMATAPPANGDAAEAGEDDPETTAGPSARRRNGRRRALPGRQKSTGETVEDVLAEEQAGQAGRKVKVAGSRAVRPGGG